LFVIFDLYKNYVIIWYMEQLELKQEGYMNILILGASGFTGKAIQDLLSKNYSVYGTYFSQAEKYSKMENMFYLDISKPEQLDNIMDVVKPQVIISSMRGDFKEQMEIHKNAAMYIAKVDNAKLIYLSTSNVFDDLDTIPHYENDKPASKSEYGQFKIACEEMLLNSLGEKAVIIRVPYIWGKQSPRIHQIIENIEQGNKVFAWKNLYTNHTTDIHIAKYIYMIIENNKTGIFHVGSSDICEYCDFIKNLIVSLRLPMPDFDEKEMPNRCYLAVLSSKEEIPPYLNISITDVITSVIT
jgi:dTDP-4-dehydrorhamnose reductase